MPTSAAFFTGSFSINSADGYGGFIATQQTVIDSVAWGLTSGSASITLNPKMTIAAGTDMTVNFTRLAGTGSIVTYR